MNSSLEDLPVFSDLRSLSTLLQDVFNVYIFPSVCFIGCVLNILCLVTLLNKNLNTKVLKFVFLIIISDLMKLFVSVFLVIFRCGALCPYGYSYFWKLYEQYIYLFYGNTWNMFGNLVNITAALERFLSFYPQMAKKFDSFLSLRVKLVILFIISAVMNVPEYIIARSTTKTGWLMVNSSNVSHYEPIYTLISNETSKIEAFKTILFIITIMRKLLLLVVLLVINALVCFKFRKYLQKKHELTHRSSTYSVTEKSQDTSSTNQASQHSAANPKTTKMIMIISISCFICNIQDSLAPILFYVIDTNAYNIYILSSNLTYFIFRSLNFIVLYICSRKFRDFFNGQFSCVKKSPLHSTSYPT